MGDIGKPVMGTIQIVAKHRPFIRDILDYSFGDMKDIILPFISVNGGMACYSSSSRIKGTSVWIEDFW